MSKEDKRPKLNPEFMDALDHFSGVRFDPNAPHAFVTSDANGRRQAWSIERVCGVAYHILSTEEIHMLKLKALVDGLKQYGMDNLYEQIMREPINKAVIER